jgi:hypothetical protein
MRGGERSPRRSPEEEEEEEECIVPRAVSEGRQKLSRHPFVGRECAFGGGGGEFSKSFLWDNGFFGAYN